MRYLRFGRPVVVVRLELKHVIAGRWVPSVPTHPAHITVSIPDPATGRWRKIRDVELPPDPRISGRGLRQDMAVEQMDQYLRQALNTSHSIELGGIRTQILRVECDREHPVWPNHGECNGALFCVPFGILDSLAVFGESDSERPLPPWMPPLKRGPIRPEAPRGMKVEQFPWMMLFRGRRFTIGFSLVRPQIVHLGWDGTGSGRANEPRVVRSAALAGLSGPSCSGPWLCTAGADYPSNTWTGRVIVRGNQILYRKLHCSVAGLFIDACFTVRADGVLLQLHQHASRDIPVLEAEAWRLAWDCGAAMTGAAAEPTLEEGRNGAVKLPMFWTGDGNGCLRWEKLSGESWCQVESHRNFRTVTGGIVPGKRPAADNIQTIPAGRLTTVWNLSVTSFEAARSGRGRLTRALKLHWGSIYSCFRPELGGFSNNALSVNCHVNQMHPAEIAAHTAKSRSGPDPMMLFRFTIERGLLCGGGYGFWRNLYLDSDPALVCGAGRCHQSKPDMDWLRKIEPGLVHAVMRMLETIGQEGLAVCRDLSGNSRSHRWSSNAMDVVGFGHIDAYVNAWTYRALRNASPMLEELGRHELAGRCRNAAERLRQAYAPCLLNPETGWVAGWRSRDGRLHDAAYLWVNGPACAFGLIPREKAVSALWKLERLRRKAGAARTPFGLPFNLSPIPEDDHMLPSIAGRFRPTFENYTDGAMAPCAATYYLRALDIHGLRREAEQIVSDLESGYEMGHFNGGLGTGVEFFRWDGFPCGYEGTFVASWSSLYGIAVHRGVLQPHRPEWWPLDPQDPAGICD